MRGWIVLRILRRHRAAVLSGVGIILVLTVTPGLRPWRWIRPHLLSYAGVSIAVTAAGAIVTLITWQLDRRVKKPDAIAAARQREVMLRRVRRKWVNEAPGGAPTEPLHLILGLIRCPDMLQGDLQAGCRNDLHSKHIPLGTPIVKLFDQTAGGLLILGQAGAGKTTLLLELARDLIVRAERETDQAMPVVVSLASWATTRQPLDMWLADELTASYSVPRERAQAWIDNDDLAILLDDLDEVSNGHRTACIAAINEYRRRHGMVCLAVCTRTQRYRALPITLNFDEAVELQPATDADVADYLDALEETGTPLGELRSDITSDEALRELARSPLMLHVIAVAYQGDAAQAVSQSSGIGEKGQRIWFAYVQQMMSRGRPPRKSSGWLAWLADALRDHNQAEFHLDRLNAGWLPIRHRRWYVRCSIRLARHLAREIKPSEELHFSWKRLSAMLAVTMPFWLLCGLIFASLGAGSLGFIYWLEMGILFAIDMARRYGLVAELRDIRTVPNEGIRRSAINGLLIGLAAGVIAGLSSGLVATLFAGWTVGLAVGSFLGVAFSMVCGFITGGKAVLQHCIVRGVLRLSGCAPLRYRRFLDDMSMRVLLRRDGSGYRFIHQTLRDYFAQHNT